MGKTNDSIKLAKLAAKNREKEMLYNLGMKALASPLVQMMGTVAIAEALESQGVLSARWAGALEGGIIAMTGLQALKEYGVIGASGLGLGIGVGALTEGKVEAVKDMALNAIFPGLGLVV